MSPHSNSHDWRKQGNKEYTGEAEQMQYSGLQRNGLQAGTGRQTGGQVQVGVWVREARKQKHKVRQKQGN